MEAQLELVAGAAVRRPLRRKLNALGLRYTEEKGWFDSQFIVYGEPARLKQLAGAIRLWNLSHRRDGA